MNGKPFSPLGTAAGLMTVTKASTEDKCIDWPAEIEKLLHDHAGELAAVTHALSSVGCLVPQMPATLRLQTVHRMLDLCEKMELPTGRSSLHFLDGRLMQALQTPERLQLATRLRQRLEDSRIFARETAMWGLVRTIPHLHSIHQKEFAQSIFSLCVDNYMRHHALEGLCTLIFSLSREPRIEMVLFFTEELKRENKFLTRYFTLELLKKVASALPAGHLLLVTDAVAPMIYHTDSDVVRKTLDFYISVMNFISPEQRYSYAQMLAALANDASLREDVIAALERIVPLLPHNEERSSFRELLESSENTISGYNFDSLEGLFEPLYSAYKH